jgi:hypothetical protein
MTNGDLEWLKQLGVPVSIMAQRAGRSETAIFVELEEQQDDDGS